MKFFIDAQLPKYLNDYLVKEGWDCKHTLDLPTQNRTTDRTIRDLVDKEDRILITKDKDFVESHLVLESPRKLVLLSVDNLRNRELLQLFELNLDKLLQLMKRYYYIEMDSTKITVHK